MSILVFPETSASVVHGMFDLFASAGRDWPLFVEGRAGESALEPRLVSASSEPFEAVNGIKIVPQGSLEDDLAPDVVCVPELAMPPDAEVATRFAREIQWLEESHARGATIATACSGAVLLAETGLLDGHEATTHWAYCDRLSREHPRIRLRPERALVVTGEGHRLIMAGGGTSWLDLALYLVARWVDVECAMQLARLNLIDWHDVGQQPFARLARSRQVADSAVARSQAWIAERYAGATPVAGMAVASGLPERSFKRRFKQATGMSPLEYVQALRLEAAKERLEATLTPIEAIANDVGYEDAGFFGRLFKRQVGLTPAQYRRRFGAMRRNLSAPGH